MLYENEFDKIWQSVVKKQIVQFSEKLGIKYKSLRILEKTIKYRFNKYKDEIVKNFMEASTARIDRHKIAACFMKAIVVSKPLYIPLDKKIRLTFSPKKVKMKDFLCISEDVKADKSDQIENILLFYNEYLAISVALTILNSYINSDNRPSRFKHEMVFPTPFPDEDEDYLLDVCIALKNTRKFQLNPITYANVFFLWEKYSCRKTQCDNLSKAYKRVLIKNGYSNEESEALLLEALMGRDRYGLP